MEEEEEEEEEEGVEKNKVEEMNSLRGGDRLWK